MGWAGTCSETVSYFVLPWTFILSCGIKRDIRVSNSGVVTASLESRETPTAEKLGLSWSLRPVLRKQHENAGYYSWLITSSRDPIMGWSHRCHDETHDAAESGRGSSALLCQWKCKTCASSCCALLQLLWLRNVNIKDREFYTGYFSLWLHLSGNGSSVTRYQTGATLTEVIQALRKGGIFISVHPESTSC